MGSRPPSPEQLIDLAWLLDSAVVLRDCDRALETADRLLEALLDHDDAMLVRRRPGRGPAGVRSRGRLSCGVSARRRSRR